MKTALVVFIILGLAFCDKTKSLRVNNGSGNQNPTPVTPAPWDGTYNSLKVTNGNTKPEQPPVTPAPWDGVYKSLKVTNDITKPEEPPIPPPKVCPTLYKECYFQGNPIQLCDKVPKFDIKTIHSVWIPDGSRVTLYEKSDYSGKSITFKQTIPCIESLNFS